MGRFHLNIRNGSGMTEDEEGLELAGPEEARRKAIEGARSMLSAEVLSGNLDLRGRIEVTDEQGDPVLTVEFRDVVSVLTGPLPSSDEERQSES